MPLKIEGNDRLQKKFDKMTAVAKARTLERAAVAGMLPIVNDAKRKAPKKTGNLTRSIHIGGHEDLNPDSGSVQQSSGAGVPEPEIGENSVAVFGGTDVIYGGPQEFGTETIPAHPYLRPAFDANRKRAVSEAGAVIKQLIEAIL